ncbi:hypothetical protein [Nocardioides sp. B-3]|uniref:hypothetical protein n=1 Tax=Nocardioides sp. B-3 TaxID=2895565 RepID=UPI00300E6992
MRSSACTSSACRPTTPPGAASWRAREWLGWNATLDEGAPADFVVYPRNPLLDLSVLQEPSYVVLRGRAVVSAR